MFAQCVSLDSYQVFLQAYGSGEIALTGRCSDHFVVSGTPGLSFGWEMKAKQIDYDQLRMTEDRGQVDTSAVNYGAEAASYLASPTAVGCSKVGIREDTLRTLIADVMGLPEFDEELFNQQLAYATVPADNEIVFHFRDGHEVSRAFVQKRQMPRQTEERKKHMSEVMKAKWRERHAESD